MMNVKRFVNQPVTSNCFLIYDNEYAGCVVVDPGTQDNYELCNYLENKKLTPQLIILTHHHFDHIWGVSDLKSKFPDSKIICNAACAEMIIDKKKNCSLYYNQIGFVTPEADIIIKDINNEIDFNGIPIKFIDAPGHSKSSIMIIIGDNLFTGDTLIKDEKTVLKLPTASKIGLLSTLETINNYKGKSLTVRGGHGPSFNLDNYEINNAL